MTLLSNFTKLNVDPDKDDQLYTIIRYTLAQLGEGAARVFGPLPPPPYFDHSFGNNLTIYKELNLLHTPI